MKFKQGVSQTSKELRTTQVGRLSLDSLSFVFAVGGVMLAFLIFTQAVDTDLTLAVKSAFMGLFVCVAMVFRVAVIGSFNYKLLTYQDLLVTVIGTAVAFASIVAAVFVFPPASAITFPEKLFFANMAIVETMFFCYFVFSWLCTLFPWILAALLTGLFFSPFHLGVYGWNPSFMAFAVIAMVIFCSVYYLTGSLFTAMASHIIFNLLASAASIVDLGPVPIVFTFGVVSLPLAFSLAVGRHSQAQAQAQARSPHPHSIINSKFRFMEAKVDVRKLYTRNGWAWPYIIRCLLLHALLGALASLPFCLTLITRFHSLWASKTGVSFIFLCSAFLGLLAHVLEDFIFIVGGF